MLIIGFSSCTKDTGEEVAPSKPAPEITFSEPRFEPLDVMQSPRLGIPPTTIIPFHQAPTIDTVIVDRFTNKLQVMLMYYHANALTSQMRIEVRLTGITAVTSSTWCHIPGYSFWLVFQDINNLIPNTDYDIRIVYQNEFGADATPWETYRTQP